MIYKLIGMAVVKLARFFLRRKAAANKTLFTAIGAAMAIALLATIAGTVGYVLTRETPEA
ncbi:MAG: hypothetical protein KDB54_04630 [Solirubrobacterales bacterium]|nr:hypothetical protein [Solirubrobacterales bacterium]MCB0859922.1 hypothetical protein [Solirubrobacterales bacterium]HRV59590.1 hypothetical protein [Solirubrobacterales bacterium]